MTAYIAQKLRENEREIAILRDLLEEERQAMKGHIDGRTAAEQERDHLREINAELLAALKETQGALMAIQEAGIFDVSGNDISGLIASNEGAIARAEGEDR